MRKNIVKMWRNKSEGTTRGGKTMGMEVEERVRIEEEVYGSEEGWLVCREPGTRLWGLSVLWPKILAHSTLLGVSSVGLSGTAAAHNQNCICRADLLLKTMLKPMFRCMHFLKVNWTGAQWATTFEMAALRRTTHAMVHTHALHALTHAHVPPSSFVGSWAKSGPNCAKASKNAPPNFTEFPRSPPNSAELTWGPIQLKIAQTISKTCPTQIPSSIVVQAQSPKKRLAKNTRPAKIHQVLIVPQIAANQGTAAVRQFSASLDQVQETWVFNVSCWQQQHLPGSLSSRFFPRLRSHTHHLPLPLPNLPHGWGGNSTKRNFLVRWPAVHVGLPAFTLQCHMQLNSLFGRTQNKQDQCCQHTKWRNQKILFRRKQQPKKNNRHRKYEPIQIAATDATQTPAKNILPVCYTLTIELFAFLYSRNSTWQLVNVSCGWPCCTCAIHFS